MKLKYYSMGVVLSAVMLTTFSSCQLTNKYKSPEVDMENLYRGKHTSDTTSIASIPWQEYFKDANLRALIGEGLENNYDLKIAVTRIQQAEVGLSIARAAYFPNVALVGSLDHKRYSSQNGKTNLLGYHTDDQYGLGVAVTWELDIWGKMNRQSKAKYAQFLSSHAYRNLIQTSLISNIATSYYALLALDKQLQVTNATIELLQESTTSMESMQEAAFLNAAAVEQSKALLYGTKVSVPALESQIRELENTISLMLGRNPGSIVRSSIDDQEIPAELKQGVPAQLLSNRPDVLQAELNFRSAFELKQAAQASLYPTISLNSGTMVGFVATGSNFFKPENIFASIMAGITQPIFARKQLTGQLKITKLQQQEALFNFEKTVLSAGKEVSDILYNYESSLKKNESREKQIESLSKSVEYTQALLSGDEANYLEVLTAEQNYLQAQLGQISDKLEQLQAAVSLYRALGGGAE